MMENTVTVDTPRCPHPPWGGSF